MCYPDIFIFINIYIAIIPYIYIYPNTYLISRYVTIGDLDELHVPRSVETLAQLIAKVKQHNIAGYNFQHKFD